MPKRSLIPTPLIQDVEREQIRTDVAPVQLRFRGLFFCSQLGRLLLDLCWLKLTGRFQSRQLGRLIRELCQRMGVLWIKVGQLVSIRRDMFPQEVCDELVKLQDSADGFSPAEARRIVEQELGGPLQRYFRDFEKTPFAAASISQIHRARLHDSDVVVAIKIRRPKIEATFAKDILVVKRFVWLLRLVRFVPHARWADLVWEIEQVMREELDYRYEAANMRRMRKTLRRHKVHVPKLYAAYCTQRVLVMEFIPGVTMSDYLKMSREDPRRLSAWLTDNGINPRRLARNVVRTHLRQAFEDNLFHADLHPGNLLLLRDNRFALIDFGCVGFLERDFLKKYDLFTQALASRDFAKMADLYFLFSASLPPIDLAAVKEEFIRCGLAFETRRRVRELPYDERSVGSLNRDWMRLLRKHGITFDWTFLRIIRTWFTMDTSLSALMQDADMRQILRRYYQERDRRRLKEIAKSSPIEAGWLRLAVDLPKMAFEQSLYRGAVTRRVAMIFEGAATRVAGFLAVTLGWTLAILATTGAYFSTAFLYQHATWLPRWTWRPIVYILEQSPQLDWQVWLVVLFVLAYFYFTLADLKKQLGAREVRLPTT